MEILIKNQAVVKILEEIGDAFRDACPEDYERFIRHVREESKALLKPSGMSIDGTLLNLLKIPSIHGYRSRSGKMVRFPDGQSLNLYGFIKQSMKKHCGIDDFFRDPSNYRLLCEVWQDAEIRRKPTAYLAVNAAASQEIKCPM